MHTHLRHNNFGSYTSYDRTMSCTMIQCAVPGTAPPIDVRSEYGLIIIVMAVEPAIVV